jgi:AcrR family transcriptional regulator
MRDIAQEVGVNEALIYQHFRSKEELFDAAVLFPLERMVARIHADADELALDASGARQREQAFQFVLGLLTALEESIALFGLVIFSDREAGSLFYRERMVPMFDLLVGAVRSQLGEWSHRPFDPRRVTLAVWGMCWGVAMDANLIGDPLDLMASAHELTDLFFYGLLTEGQRADLAAQALP